MSHSKLKNERLDKLFRAILKLEALDECYAFFEDVCTINELNAIAQRLEVAFLLNDGVTYNEIVEKTGASTATISRVNRCLHYGTGGYRAIIDKTEPE
jgi:TrpR-related protein YerC/YecD